MPGGHCVGYDATSDEMTEARGRCPKCGAMRVPNIYHTLDGRDRALADRTLGELGVPAWEVVGARAGLRQRFYEFAGDRADVLGALAQSRPGAHDIPRRHAQLRERPIGERSVAPIERMVDIRDPHGATLRTAPACLGHLAERSE